MRIEEDLCSVTRLLLGQLALPECCFWLVHKWKVQQLEAAGNG